MEGGSDVLMQYGVLGFIAVAYFLQNKVYHDQATKREEDQIARSTKQLDDFTNQSVAREERMGKRIDLLENEVRTKLENMVIAQQQVITDNTVAFREVSSVIAKLQTSLPKSSS